MPFTQQELIAELHRLVQTAEAKGIHLRAIGGLGGFFLPLLFAWAKVKTGEPESTFLVLLASALVSLIWLHLVVIKMRRDERHHTTATIDTDTTTKGAI